MKKKNWADILTGEAAISLMETGRLVREARKRRNMTLRELANRAGVDPRTLAQLEAGQAGVSIGTFFQVLSILNLVRGIEEFLKPENDIETAALKVRRIRKKKRTGRTLSPEEVNF